MFSFFYLHDLSARVKASSRPTAMTFRRLLSTCVFIFSLFTSGLALADLTADQAIARAQSQYDGQAISTSEVMVDGRKAYRIKLLQPSGRLRVLLIDAQSGKFLSLKSK